MSKSICERCGVEATSQAHLAVHLKDGHGMSASNAIYEAKAMRDRCDDKDARIRDAAPDLLAACESALSFWQRYVDRTGAHEPWANEVLNKLRDAVAKAKGEAL